MDLDWMCFSQWRSEGPAGPATGGPRGGRGPPGRSIRRKQLVWARGPNKLFAGARKSSLRHWFLKPRCSIVGYRSVSTHSSICLYEIVIHAELQTHIQDVTYLKQCTPMKSKLSSLAGLVSMCQHEEGHTWISPMPRSSLIEYYYYYYYEHFSAQVNTGTANALM